MRWALLSRDCGLPAERRAVRRSLECDHHRFHLRIGLDAVASIFAAPAGLLEATARNRVVERAAIDAHRACAQSCRYLVSRREVAREDVGGQAVARIVRLG